MRLQRGRQGAGDHDLLPGCAPPRCTRPLEAPLPWPWTAQGGPTSSWRAHRKAQAQRTTRSVSRESARRPHDEHVGSRASPPKVPENIAQDPRTVAPGPTQCSGGASTRLPLYAPTAAKARRTTRPHEALAQVLDLLYNWPWWGALVGFSLGPTGTTKPW